jgi:hypothetical protein
MPWGPVGQIYVGLTAAQTGVEHLHEEWSSIGTHARVIEPAGSPSCERLA